MPSSLSGAQCLLRVHGFLYFLNVVVIFFFQSGNSTKHMLNFKLICLACSGCYEMQIKMLASKGDGVL